MIVEQRGRVGSRRLNSEFHLIVLVLRRVVVGSIGSRTLNDVGNISASVLSFSSSGFS